MEQYMFFLNRSLFLATNIILLYIFLTPKRTRVFQVVVFLLSWFVIYFLRLVTGPLNIDPLLESNILGSLYLIPCMLIFSETPQAKFFVFYMIYSLSQLTYLVFMYVDRFLFPAIPQMYILIGMILEIALLPVIKRYMKTPIREIVDILNKQNPVFTMFPVLSFLLLVIYSLQETNLVFEFITLVISTVIIFFSYFMISISISGTRRQQELELISMTDNLTGLYNRRYVERRFQEEYLRYGRTGQEFTLIIADIDFFKKINDTYGHACGDFLLKAVSEDIRKSVRTYDVVVRWGGDEFFVLLPATNEELGLNLAERIRKTVETSRYDYNSNLLAMTLTLGVSIVKPGDTPDGMIKKADVALYYGKKNNRNCTILYNENIE